MTSDPELGIAACHCHTLRHAARHLTQFYDRMLAPAGVKATQFPVLAALMQFGTMPLGALAARLGMDRATLGHNIRPMLAQGWLEMAPGEDRRRRDLALSAAGREVLEAALPLWQAAQAGFAAGFGAERAVGLRAEAAEAARVALSRPGA